MTKFVFPRVSRIAIVGAGLMGRNIGLAFARRGHVVTFVDASDGVARITATTLAAEHSIPRPQLNWSDLPAAVHRADLVIEAVSESVDVKSGVLRDISQHNGTVSIASNTSTFQPSTLQQYVRNPDRLLVAHFFNPADAVPLVEVVASEETSAELVTAMTALLRDIGKLPVVLRKEYPGFVANRLQAAVLREAMHLVDAGVVDADELDTVVKSSLGPRWAALGPLRTADLGGLVVFRALCGELFPQLDAATVPPDSLRDMVESKRTGISSGSGFYEYDATSAAHFERAVRAAF